MNNVLNLIKKKNKLIQCVFATLIAQLIVSFVVFYRLRDRESELLDELKEKYPVIEKRPLLFHLFIPVAILYTLLYVINSVESFSLKFVFFTLFSGFFGFLMNISKSTVSSETIMFALLSTISVFVAMLSFAALLIHRGVDFLKYGGVLFGILLLLVIGQLMNLFLIQDSALQKFLKIVGLILFIIYIIYHTYTMLFLKTNFNNDCISGAISYYMDFINIFSRLSSVDK